MINIAIAITFILIFLAGCSKPVATVNGRDITEKEYLMELKDRMLNPWSNGLDELTIKNLTIDSLIDRYLILEEASKRGISVTDKEVEERFRKFRTSFMTDGDYERFLSERKINDRDVRKRLRVQMIVEKFTHSLADILSVSLDDVEKEYKIRRPVKKPMTVKLSMIEVINKDKADEIMKDIKLKTFDRVVSKLSELKNAKDITYLKPGWVSIDIFTPEVMEMLKNAGSGVIIGPVKKDETWYIMKVHERRPPQYKTFDEAKEEILFELIHKKRLTLLDEFIKKRREESKIIIYGQRL